MEETIRNENIDIIIGCEPNLKIGTKHYCDKNCDSFVNICNNLSVIGSGGGEGYAWVELREMVIVSCYFSPNGLDDNFEELLENLTGWIRKWKKEVIVGGDFNAKTPVLGSDKINRRGILLESWIESNEMVILNTGKQPTMVRESGTSIIDCTLGTARIANKIKNWRVDIEQENFSDHRTLKFEIWGQTKEEKKSKKNIWKLTTKNTENFERNLSDLFVEEEEYNAEQVVQLIQRLCEKCLKNRNNGRDPVYWWNDEIKKKRKECNSYRRKVTRSKLKNLTAEEMEGINKKYKVAKKELKEEIYKSKLEKWKQICGELEENVWGKAYQIITGKLKMRKKQEISEETMKEQIKHLFPERPIIERKKQRKQTQNSPIFDKEELKLAMTRMKKKKAPGPDGITTEILEKCVITHGKIFLDMYNRYLKTATFPEVWKRGRLVLVEKPKKNVGGTGGTISYRPICLIDTMAKLFERLMGERIQGELMTKKLISSAQYGFRRGKSTVDALKRVKEITEEIKMKAVKNRDFCAMVLIDVANAFNSAPWYAITKAMEDKQISPYLIQLVESYLENREVLTERNTYPMTCGVPQGSVLGPILWNIYYDEVLRIKVEPGVELVAYADDLAVVVRAKTGVQLEEATQFAVQRVMGKLEEMGLTVARQKTEMVLLAGRRKVREMQITLGGEVVRSLEAVKYLGVSVERNFRMGMHVGRVAERANQMINLYIRIMPRIGGCSANKRKIMASAITSAVLYAAPIWGDACGRGVHRAKLGRVNRRLAIGVASAYRTISLEAVQAIAGMPPIDLLVRERMEICEGERGDRGSARDRLYQRWQEEWNKYEGFARIFIKNVKKWTTREFGNVNFYITQALSGHGVFGTYLCRIGKAESGKCWFCGEVDDPQHTIFQCEEFDGERRTAERACGTRVDLESVAELLIRNEKCWNAVAGMLEGIMRAKEVEERRRERRKREGEE